MSSVKTFLSSFILFSSTFVLAVSPTFHRTASFNNEPDFKIPFSIPNPLEVVDLDQDGDDDIISMGVASGEVVCWENTGESIDNWPKHVYHLFPNGSCIDTVDINQDDNLDLVVGSKTNGFMWIENPGSLDDTWTTHTISSSFDLSDVCAADLDGDDDIDLATTKNSRHDNLYWWENNDGLGESWTSIQIPSGIEWPQAIDCANFDEDSDIDILATCNTSSVGVYYFFWLMNNGDASGWQTRGTGNLWDPKVALARDMDGDGDVDVFAAGGFDPAYPASVGWWENLPGNENDVWPRHLIEEKSSLSIADGDVADLDLDGDMDAITCDENHQDGRRLAWYENTNEMTPNSWVVNPLAYYQGTSLRGIRVGDMDGNGLGDLVASVNNEDVIAIWMNRGGHYQLTTDDIAPVTVQEGNTIGLLQITVTHIGRTLVESIELASVAIQCLDGSGQPLQNSDAQILFNSIVVYLDEGSGTFNSQLDTEVATFPPSLDTQGRMVLDLPDNSPDVTINPGESQVFYIAASIKQNASLHPVNEFMVRHLTNSWSDLVSTAEQQSNDAVLDMSYVEDVTSSEVLITTSNPSDLPLKPQVIPVLHVQIVDVPSEPETDSYDYVWSCEDSGEVLSHLNKSELEDMAQEGDLLNNGVDALTLDVGETWTVTVTPKNSEGTGDSFVGEFIITEKGIKFEGWTFH